MAEALECASTFLRTGTVFAVELTAGWITIVEARLWLVSNWIPLVLILLVLEGPVALTEEIVMRGYLLQNLEEGMGTKWAVVLSSLFFGILHLANPSAKGWTVLVVPVSLTLFGVVNAAAYLAKRSICLPIGFHFAWNLCEY